LCVGGDVRVLERQRQQPVWKHSAPRTPDFYCVTLFSFPPIFPFSCTACGRLVVSYSHDLTCDRPAVFATSAVNGFHLNNSHFILELG
jgi:hypothetical protein